jgi:hypothetical protein
MPPASLGFSGRPPRAGRRRCIAATLLSALAVFAAGCHHNTNDSGYGIAWVTLTSEPGGYQSEPFTSYVINIDSITLTDAAGNEYTALATVEPVDLVKLTNIAELWGSATVPNDTYVSATITLDYTNAEASMLVGGVSEAVKLQFPDAAALTTVSVTVKLDPAHQPVIVESFGTYNAIRLAIDFNLADSNVIDTSTNPITVTADPFLTVGIAPADTRLIRIRGPLINSSADVGTYTVYVRPFYDEVNSNGSVSIFNGPDTIYTIDGTTYVGQDGLNQLTQVSAGVTATEAYTTFQVTATADALAGKFNSVYMVAGGSLETNYTENVSGLVTARNGDVLTLSDSTVAGATVSLAEGYFVYSNPVTNVLVGPTTVVTAEGNATLTGLDYNSISVGQRISAIGVYTLPSSGIVTIDATAPTTGSTSGQVRLESTRLFGTLLSAAADTLSVSLQDFELLPAAKFNYAGTGTTAAQDVVADDYIVNTTHAGTTNLAGVAPGTALWIDGFVTGFGAAPPDFNAFPAGLEASAVNQEASVPASLEVDWTAAGTTTPFTTVTAGGFSINLANAAFASGVIRIGPEIVTLASLPASPSVVPNLVPSCVAGNTQPCIALFSFGTAATGITSVSSFPTFVTDLAAAITTAAPVTRLQASGFYNRTTNTFTANSVNIVL